VEIAVIIPLYNGEQWIGATLDSVASQTREPEEIIVVDDGSTADIQGGVDGVGPDVRYLRQSNAGPSVARSRGLRHARGESVMFLDSDDLLLPEALESLVGTLKRRPEAGGGYGGYYRFFGDGSPGDISHPRLPPGDYASPWPDQDVRPYGLTASGDVFPELIMHDCFLMGATLVRRPAVEKSRGFDTALPRMEHWGFFVRLAANGVQFAAAERPVLLLRMHRDSLSSNFQRMLRRRLKIIDRYFSPAPEEDGRNSVRGRKSVRMEPMRYELKPGHGAFGFLGSTMVLCGDLEGGLRRVRKALSQHHLPLDTYDDFTEELCIRCNAAANPEQTMRSLLNILGAFRNAQSLRDYVLGRFFLVWAKRTAARAPENDDRRFWAAMPEALRRVVRSGVCLKRALVYRPGLIRMYAHLISRKLPQRSLGDELKCYSWLGRGVSRVMRPVLGRRHPRDSRSRPDEASTRGMIVLCHYG